MSSHTTVPETRVLAIASHVVHGYVGNTMATFVMQSLGCEVSALNTVNYSNHLAYRQATGTQTTAGEILELYEGLRQSSLNDFDVLLSGYIPSADAIEAVGKIGRELKLNSATKPGSFFWVLDPVLGDNGKLYVPGDEVPVYKQLLREADLILPNQFEAELLSDTKITSLTTLAAAIKALHTIYNIPHIIITSLRLSADSSETLPPSTPTDTLTCIGSTARAADRAPRLFRVDVPALPVVFSGTGDMFAALTVARLREAVAADAPALAHVRAWVPPDDVPATALPLARAVEKVLASMHAVLEDTAAHVAAAAVDTAADEDRAGLGTGEEAEGQRELFEHVRRTRAAEVRVVRNVEMLRDPPGVERFTARAVEVEEQRLEGVGEAKPDELGVTKVSGSGEGAVDVEGTEGRR